MAEPLVPREVFFTKGIGKHRTRLQSFELALRDAGIEIFNLVRVSSIFPPHCKVVSKKQGLPKLQPGQITYCVLAEASTNEPSRMVGAGIGLAVPSVGEQYGYISEHHDFGITEPRYATWSKTWPPPCWPPRWASNSTLKRLTTTARKSTTCPARSFKPGPACKRPRAIKKASGPP